MAKSKSKEKTLQKAYKNHTKTIQKTIQKSYENHLRSLKQSEAQFVVVISSLI